MLGAARLTGTHRAQLPGRASCPSRDPNLKQLLENEREEGDKVGDQVLLLLPNIV